MSKRFFWKHKNLLDVSKKCDKVLSHLGRQQAKAFRSNEVVENLLQLDFQVCLCNCDFLLAASG